VISASRLGLAEGIQDKVLKGDEAYTERPGSLLPDADLEAERKEIETKLEREVSENEFASYLMYPKVFTDFALATETYGPVSMLPTPAYFYGLPVGGELFVEIEKGKTLVIRISAVGEPDDKGMVTVFFELNGQPTAGQGSGPGAWRLGFGSASQGRSRQRRPCGSPDAGRDLDRRRRCRPGGQGRRRAGVDRGDEDGNGYPRRARRHAGRSACEDRGPDRCQGSPGGHTPRGSCGAADRGPEPARPAGQARDTNMIKF
jgi:hypothetical protein